MGLPSPGRTIEPSLYNPYRELVAEVVPGWIETLKAWTEIGGNVAEAVALLVGGIWAYNRFIRQREEWPRATIKHHIRHFNLSDQRRILRVTERIENAGPVLIEICERRTTVQQILPVLQEPLASLADEGKHEADWFALGMHVRDDSESPAVIEPDEGDQFDHDFLIDDEAQVIQVYSYFKNMKYKDRDLGWSLTTLYDLRSTEETHETAADLKSREE